MSTRPKILEDEYLDRDRSFLKTYKDEFININKIVKDYNPDYVLALIRKGPRLIELMHSLGAWNNDATVITERALDFIPFDKINNSRIVIFDDIIISGTTIRDLITKLSEKYDLEILVTSLAIDKDTIAQNAIPKGIEFKYRKGLSRDERFSFSHDLVKSFAILNKPYDLDFSIFYTRTNREIISSLLENNQWDHAFDLTTKYQNDNGFERYSLIPKENFGKYFVKYTCSNHLDPEICKVRMYNNRIKGDTTFAPMVVFNLDKKICNSFTSFFNQPFSHYNDLIDNARDLAEISSNGLPVFKLIWYILSYLYGLSFNIRQSNENCQLIPFSYPSQILRFRDLVYIFGPDLAKTIFKCFDDNLDDSINELRAMQNCHNNLDLHILCDNSIRPDEDESFKAFDYKRQKAYSMIQPYINTHLSRNRSLSDNLGIIFEAMYCAIEIEAQEAIRLKGIIGEEHNRLDSGFTFTQLKEILSNEGISCSDIDLSLCLDFLVDSGVQIPIFNEDENGIFERAYRYGEEGLSGRKYEYIITHTIKALFDYDYKGLKVRTLPKIFFEKMGVIIYDKIIDSGDIDILSEILEEDDRYIKIVPDKFYRHGRIVHINDAAMRTDDHGYMFLEWCRSIGVIKYGKDRKNIVFDRYWFENYFSTYDLPQLVSNRILVRYQSLSYLLYHINMIDTEKESNYLVAITSCNSNENFLKSIQAAIQLFFENNKFKFFSILQNIRTCLYKNSVDIFKAIRGPLKSLRTNTIPAINAIEKKKKLKDNLEDIIDNIEKYFSNCTPELYSLYIDHLGSYFENTDPAIREYEIKMIIFGRLCINLSNLLRSLLEFGIGPEKEAKDNISLVKSFNENANSWNRYIREQSNVIFNGIFIEDLPVIELAEIDSNFQNTEIYKSFAIDIFSQILIAYQKLEKIYNNSYSDPRFNEIMGGFFPRKDNNDNTELKKGTCLDLA